MQKTEEKVQLQLRIPAGLKRRLKIESARTGEDMSEITRDTLRRELNRRDKKRDRQPTAAAA